VDEPGQEVKLTQTPIAEFGCDGWSDLFSKLNSKNVGTYRGKLFLLLNCQIILMLQLCKALVELPLCSFGNIISCSLLLNERGSKWYLNFSVEYLAQKGLWGLSLDDEYRRLNNHHTK
jgi:hypothetical protein